MSYPSANPSLLYTASQKCVEHRNKHVENNISPHDCKRNMASLKRVVNKIEQTEAQSWSCSPSELCFFYRSILTCSFCPHAMTIFEEGSLSDILPRVSLLLSTTMSPTVHSPSENLETICSTIATFLGKVRRNGARRDANWRRAVSLVISLPNLLHSHVPFLVAAVVSDLQAACLLRSYVYALVSAGNRGEFTSSNLSPRIPGLSVHLPLHSKG